jgi:lauroyl/myristoyl acyltransferase
LGKNTITDHFGTIIDLKNSSFVKYLTIQFNILWRVLMKLNLSTFLQWRFNIYLYNKLGWRICFYYIIFLGNLYFFFKKNEKDKIRESLRAVFSQHKTINEIRSITQNVFKGIIFHYYEKLFNAYSPVDTLKSFFQTHVVSQNKDVIEKALEKGKGVLLITGHLGGVEFLPTYLGSNKYPVSIVVRFKSNHLRQMSLLKAPKYSARIIDVDHTPNVMKAICESLKNNRIVIMQCDEIDEWKPSRHETISFLGKSTYLDRTMNVLAKRGDAPVVFGMMHRNQNHDYEFFAASREDIVKRFPCAATRSIGELALKFFEQYIYAYPEEWYEWKKYTEIQSLPSSAEVAVETPSAAMLIPAFVEAS